MIPKLNGNYFMMNSKFALSRLSLTQLGNPESTVKASSFPKITGHKNEKHGKASEFAKLLCSAFLS